ncbi:MAG TPA: secondary thiamine-phosphate synthase enzyme YjbQ [Bryobacteraceae bacterium]|nr:secondary thiamine-phosphate synthase enzyme YjbQ [Bryobacteraceae bacterium]
MSIPKIQIVEPPVLEDSPQQPSGPQQVSPQGTYKVVSRIVDWITNDRLQLLNITERINEIVRRSGVRDGIVHLQSLHTTSAVFINEWQDALLHDVRNFFDQVVDRNQYYRHNDPIYSDCERKNADSHMRGMLMGQTLSLQVRNATVLLGTWQSIIFAEFDGPRSRSLAVQVSGV